LTWHLEAEAGWRGVAERSCGMAGVGRHEVGDGTDRWGPLLRLGKDCGFDDKDDRELLDVMSFAANGA
jgi:hypothetical protein